MAVRQPRIRAHRRRSGAHRRRACSPRRSRDVEGCQLMTASNGHTADVVEGIVESANDRGVKVGGDWRNVSRFHPVELPDRGARVRLELDGKGFIRSVQILETAAKASSTTTTRDREIRRMAVLKATANFLGLMSQCREEVKSDHVLVLADRWLAWVEQPEPADEG